MFDLEDTLHTAPPSPSNDDHLKTFEGARLSNMQRIGRGRGRSTAAISRHGMGSAEKCATSLARPKRLLEGVAH